MNDLIKYQPLTEATTISGGKYYKSCTPAEFFKIRSDNDSIYFDVSKIAVVSSQITNWKEADPEDVAIAWETMDLNAGQKRIFEASKKIFLDFWGGAKVIRIEQVKQFASLAKQGKVISIGR